MPPPKIPKKVLDIIKAQRAELARLVPAHRRAIIEAAASVQRDLLARLQALDPASFSAQEVRARLVEIGAIVDATGRDYGVKVGNAAKDVATIAAGVARDGLVDQLVAWAPRYKDSIRRVGTVAKAAGVLDAGLLEYHESSKATYGLEAIQKMRASMARSALAGESLAQAWPGMARALDIPEWRAERIVRTEQAFAANRSELQQIEAMYGKKAAREGFRKQLITTFDQRTGDDSVSVHEQVRELDEPFEDNQGRQYQHPPNRPNDREVMVIIPAPDDDYEAILGQLERMTDQEQDAFVGRELEAAVERLQGGGRQFRAAGPVIATSRAQVSDRSQVPKPTEEERLWFEKKFQELNVSVVMHSGLIERANENRKPGEPEIVAYFAVDPKGRMHTAAFHTRPGRAELYEEYFHALQAKNRGWRPATKRELLLDEIEAQELLIAFGEANGWEDIEIAETKAALKYWERQLKLLDEE